MNKEQKYVVCVPSEDTIQTKTINNKTIKFIDSLLIEDMDLDKFQQGLAKRFRFIIWEDKYPNLFEEIQNAIIWKGYHRTLFVIAEYNFQPKDMLLLDITVPGLIVTNPLYN